MKLLHIVAGFSGLAAGMVALVALKGAKLHRQSGMIFVYAMLFLSASGTVMAALKPQVISATVIAGVLTFYLVLTALLTVRPPAPESRWVDAVAMMVALTVGLAAVGFGFAALASVEGRKDGQPAALYFVFGAVALVATLGDLRLLRARRLFGARRIARHLWRMCFALFVATGSLFLGLPRLFPKPLRDSGLLAIPVLFVLFAMFYWLGRVWLGRRPLVLFPRTPAFIQAGVPSAR